MKVLLKGISFLLKELVHMFKAGIMGVQISLGCNAEKVPKDVQTLIQYRC